jgi:predicted nucleic acid-binding protein
VAVEVFFDTSVLVAGVIDLGPQSAPAQSLMHAVAEQRIPSAGTAWHCCLEFYSVSTRLPAEFRLSAGDAARLMDEEIFARLSVHDLPAADRAAMMRLVVDDRIVGGRIYDVHIAEVARAARARVIVTDNRRHFLSALRHGLRIETPSEFLQGLRKRDTR